MVGVYNDMRFTPGRRDGPGFSAGIGSGVATIFFTNTTVRMIPIEFNYVFGKGSNSLLIGTRIANMKFNSETLFLPESKTIDSATSPMFHIAYRHQPKYNGFFFQVGL